MYKTLSNVSRQCFQTVTLRRPINVCMARRRLRVAGLRCHRPKKRFVQTNMHKNLRLNWVWVGGLEGNGG